MIWLLIKPIIYLPLKTFLYYYGSVFNVMKHFSYKWFTSTDLTSHNQASRHFSNESLHWVLFLPWNPCMKWKIFRRVRSILSKSWCIECCHMYHHDTILRMIILIIFWLLWMEITFDTATQFLYKSQKYNIFFFIKPAFPKILKCPSRNNLIC